MSTVIHLSNSIDYLPAAIMNWNSVPQVVKNHLLQGTDYRPGRQELLVYDERTIIASCSVENWNDEKQQFQMEISDCWIRDKRNLWPQN